MSLSKWIPIVFQDYISFKVFFFLAVAGVVFGYLHFVTFDGLSYTFSGKGEYYLVLSEDRQLRVQARTEQLKLENGKFTFYINAPIVLLFHSVQYTTLNFSFLWMKNVLGVPQKATIIGFYYIFL